MAAPFNEQAVSGTMFDSIERLVIDLPENGEAHVTVIGKRKVDAAGVVADKRTGNRMLGIYQGQNTTDTVDWLDFATGDSLGKTVTLKDFIEVCYSVGVAVVNGDVTTPPGEGPQM